MLPQTHLLLGIIFVAVIFLIFPSVGIMNAAIILAASVLIDIDHYFYYIYKIKKLSPIKAYEWYRGHHKKCKAIPKEKKSEIHFGTCVLHGIEILILLFALGFFVSNIFYFILIGFTFHLITDLSAEITLYNRFNKVSVIYSFLKSKGLTFIDDLEL